MMIANRESFAVRRGSQLDFTLFRSLVDGSISGDITAEMLDGITKLNSVRANGSPFSNTTNITSIELPPSCTSVPPYAFYSCTRLRSAVIPGTVRTIPNHFFSYCTALTSVVLGEGITGFTGQSGGGWAFEACNNLKQVVFPDSIANYSSYQCFQSSGVTHVTFGTGCSAIAAVFFGNSRYVVDVTFRGLSMAAVQEMANYPWKLNQYSGRTVTFHCTDGDFVFTT